MEILEGSVSSIEVKTRVRRKTDSQGRSKTTQKHRTILELNSQEQAFYSGSTGIRKGNKVILVVKPRQKDMHHVLAYHNLSRKEQGPTKAKLRGDIIFFTLLLLGGLLALLVGLPLGKSQGSSSALVIGSAILLFALYLVISSAQNLLAIRKLENYLRELS
jgi:hypothetical protein